MAVAPTGAIYKALKFDNVSSRTYGVYITGEAVYNAPERDVEMITIPGRNGSFALDNGRFQNIEVSYPAGIFADTEADFRQAISDFRNFLCSRKGYVRLTDEYNPNEYRMAVYKSGLEVDPAQLRAGEFEITFDCKPQRWLTSGESAVTIANSGDTITNPTLFDASPMLEVEGYGTLEFNGYDVEIENGTMGTVHLWDESSASGVTRYNVTKVIPQGLLNIGDTFTVSNLSYNGLAIATMATQPTSITINATHQGISGAEVTATYEVHRDTYQYYLRKIVNAVFPSLNFTYGSPSSYTDQQTITESHYSGQNLITSEIILETNFVYDGNNTVVFTCDPPDPTKRLGSISAIIPEGTGQSSVSIMGNPTYIDCDIGEAYKIEGGSIVSLNAFIDLGSDLPTLAPGTNTVTYDNTITGMNITPRWWKI